jgi:hypothetical protein
MIFPLELRANKAFPMLFLKTNDKLPIFLTNTFPKADEMSHDSFQILQTKENKRACGN